MSGVLIGATLLRADAALAALMPAAQIDAWELPQGAGLPSIVLTRVSRPDQVMLDGTSLPTVTERVQATVRATSGAQRETILRLGRAACNGKRGTIAGFTDVIVMLAGIGPDFMNDAASIFMGSFDLRISFNEAA